MTSRFGILIVTTLLSTSLVSHQVSAMDRSNIRDACPQDWESFYNEFAYQSGQNHWYQVDNFVEVYNLPDKAQFVRYAADAFFLSDLVPWNDGSSQLVSFTDWIQIARHCGAHHLNYYSELRNQASVLRSQIQNSAIVQADSDQDGVNDAIDVCPDTVSGQSVSIQGCAATQEIGGEYRDSDGDGMLDYLDPYPLQSSSFCPAI